MNIAISGAWIIPAMVPAIPMSAKFSAGRDSPKMEFKAAPKTDPVMHPANNVGAKSPATPPPLLVEIVAKALTMAMPPQNNIIIVGDVEPPWHIKLPEVRACVLPSINSAITL